MKVQLPFGLICGIIDAMTLQPQSRRKPGPPATGKGIPVQVRVQPDLLDGVDRFIAEEAPGISRPEAIRRLTVEALQKMGLFDVRG